MPGAATAQREKPDTSGIVEQKDASDDITEPHRTTFPPEITGVFFSKPLALGYSVTCTLKHLN